jgi:hypothetical protein
MSNDELHELRWLVAEHIRSKYSQDWLWNEVERMALLARQRRKIQPAAKRAKKNPIAFVKRVAIPLGLVEPDVLDSPKVKVPTRKEQTFRQFIQYAIRMNENPNLVSELDRTELRKQWLSLFSGDPGARRKQMHRDAYALKSAGKSLHRICGQLRPDYSKKSPLEQGAIRKCMREGIRRYARSLNTAQAK